MRDERRMRNDCRKKGGGTVEITIKFLALNVRGTGSSEKDICRTVMRSDFCFNRIPMAAIRSTDSSYARVQERPVRRATVIIQEREDGVWARVVKMRIVRKDQILHVFGR